ncbi:MAG: 23S rRNA accumulation protein YceD [Gammaproteobacteria bacterium]|nr:MAG: 23S rRNA accumulation protein YceD [Gammaproteobacteria bacterium]
MSRRIPEHIDPFRLAEADRQIAGRLPLEQMQRLAPSLVSSAGAVEIDLMFQMDDIGVPCIKGKLHATLQVICQRCMEPMGLNIDASICLGLVDGKDRGEELPGEYEPLVIGEAHVSLPDIIEDELILALPVVPMHELAECPAAEHVAASTETTEETVKENPFAVLKQFKSNHEDNQE